MVGWSNRTVATPLALTVTWTTSMTMKSGVAPMEISRNVPFSRCDNRILDRLARRRLSPMPSQRNHPDRAALTDSRDLRGVLPRLGYARWWNAPLGSTGVFPLRLLEEYLCGTLRGTFIARSLWHV
jgi:hypothetical protein